MIDGRVEEQRNEEGEREDADSPTRTHWQSKLIVIGQIDYIATLGEVIARGEDTIAVHLFYSLFDGPQSRLLCTEQTRNLPRKLQSVEDEECERQIRRQAGRQTDRQTDRQTGSFIADQQRLLLGYGFSLPFGRKCSL